jgi:RHH-type proline utilization regulon transcriptional repressor/proline dehydrogenase/delta 1-pyrroline-5-carboxylate dehydrogenase
VTVVDEAGLVARTEERALALLTRSIEGASSAERRRAVRLGRLVGDDAGRDFVLDLTDRVLRIRDPARSAQTLRRLVSRGVPASVRGLDRVGLAALSGFAPVLPGLVGRLVDARVGRDTDDVILPFDDPGFAGYVRRRTREGFRVNVNVLGEAILGDDEADRRLAAVVDRIRRRDVRHVSVKISAICANLDVLAEADSLARIEERLAVLYREARRARPRVLVTLDMEEYRDLELSVRSVVRTLGGREFADLEAGIVLQAYLPDAHAALEALCGWADRRRERGGAPVRVRLVKGANLAMEQVEAELHGWPAAPYPSKAEVDASFKAMLETALTLPRPDALRVGVASHNLFDVAWAITLADALGARDRLDVEMLEGMAPPQARAARDEAGGLLLYAPVVSDRERDASIAYLTRRLDENAGPENFLRALFTLTPGSPAWQRERDRFRAAVADRRAVSTVSRRVQDRTVTAPPVPADGSFDNTSDTDFTVPEHRRWIEGHLAEARVPGVDLVDTVRGVDAAVARALTAQAAWSRTSWADRRRVLAEVARVMADDRGRTIAVMAHTTGKTVREGDPEVSEAIDFARYAAALTCDHEDVEREGARWAPHRLVVVAGPWNFPYAIPASGAVHALAGGAAVIVKPAPEARAVAALLVGHLQAVGLPDGLVQLAATPDDEVGRHLVTHDAADLVVLTGSAHTAALFLSWKPSMALHGETSGKNSMVITAAADVDQALRDLARSAFGHAGQKCSAASLAVVEAPLYDDPAFLARVADVVRSLPVGEATELRSVVGPLIGPPRGPLQRALTTLDEGESWLVEPRHLGGTLWSPGVRRDVRPGSWFHRTECFGPVLGLVRAHDLDHAIEVQNAPAYGLTGGIHSLDPLEVQHWLDRVEVGNAYVNRHITGAVVRRQPFGGWKASSVGPGWKPGGPHHLGSYGTWTPAPDAPPPGDSYARAWRSFRNPQDPSGLAAESNVLRHVPVDRIVARVATPEDRQLSWLREASRVTGIPLEVSVLGEQTEDDLAARLRGMPGTVRLRLLAPASDALLTAAHTSGVAVDRAPVTSVGRSELPHWVREQSISITMHRHGRLLRRPWIDTGGELTGRVGI